MNITLGDVALHLMTCGISKEYWEKVMEQWEFRKGKGFADLKKAQRKAKKNGMLRTEFEISMAQVYVKDVLKKRRVKKDGQATSTSL